MSRETELEMATDILCVISHLSDEEEAEEYMRLYLKAHRQNYHESKAADVLSEENEFQESEVRRLVAETDRRIEPA
jgi:hypothetical protein